MIALLVFLGAVVLDYVCAVYIQSTSDRRPVKAALAAGGLTLANSLVTILYVGEHWLVLPFAAGGVVGTYVACHRSR